MLEHNEDCPLRTKIEAKLQELYHSKCMYDTGAWMEASFSIKTLTSNISLLEGLLKEL